MKTVSIKVTVTDDEFYDWFIEPHKINGELPNLVLRLLTAYANNSELAFQIDQFLDKDNEPEAFEVREAIMQAITQLNSLEATANQELEALSDGVDALDEDEDDIIVTSGDVYTPETVAKSIGSMIGLPDTPTEMPDYELPEIQPELPEIQPEPSTPSQQGTTTEFEGKMFSALDTLTSQISNLTNAVTQMITVSQQPMMIPMQAGYVYPQVAYPTTQQGIQTPMQAFPNSVQPTNPVENSVPQVPQTLTPSNTAQNGSNLGFSTVGGEIIPPIETSPLNRISDGSTANQQIVENSVENVENSDDDYSVPDFMADMIDSCL